MLSELKHSVTFVICAILVNCACSSNREISINETDAEMFLYNSPITALTDAGDSLLLGTARGDIVSFSLINGTFRHIHHDTEGGFIYKLLKVNDSYLYSVQDGGIKHVLADGSEHLYPLNSYKESNYSAYDMIYSEGNIYAATSNGVYYWDEPDKYAKKRLDESIQKDLNDAVLSRFYSIQKDDDDSDAFICAGEAGLYSFSVSGDTECFSSFAISSNKDNITLSRDRKIHIDSKYLTQISIPALDFVRDGKYLYALSMHAIEIVNISNGRHVITINLPERKSIYKNASCRSFSLIKDDYIYLSPGGCTLYRVPLYNHMTDSEEIVQVCAAGGKSVYFLTVKNDLYRYDINTSRVDYRRSFDETEEVKLIGAGNDSIIVTIDGVYYELTGKRLTDKKYLSDLNKLNKSKVLWHLQDGDHLYQGQVDRIREYTRSGGWRLRQEFEQLDYPNQAALCRNGLIVNTLHEGRFLLREGRFEKFEGLSDVQLKDIDGRDNIACGLTDSEIILKTMTKDNYRIDLQVNASYNHMTDLIALNERKLVLFSSYNRWCKGIVRYEEQLDGSWESSRFLKTHTVNDAIRVGEYVVSGGTMGLCILHPNDNLSIVYVPAPTFFEKNVLAWNYPWGIIIFIVLTILTITVLVYGIICFRRYYLKFRYVRMYASFNNWINTEFSGSYVRNLARQLKQVSGDHKSLQEGIAVIKKHKDELLILEDIMTQLENIQIAADELRPRRSKIYDGSKYEQKLEDYKSIIKARLKDPLVKLYDFCLETHPFGYSIINEWGIRKGRGLFLMLAPLSPKIRFLEMCDPDTYQLGESYKDNNFAIARPGSEKMDFKAFMDNKKSHKQARNLEIRDLIALSAYEAIVSEKGTADA